MTQLSGGNVDPTKLLVLNRAFCVFVLGVYLCFCAGGRDISEIGSIGYRKQAVYDFDFYICTNVDTLLSALPSALKS